MFPTHGLTVAVDATGFETRHVSAHYARQTPGRRRERCAYYPKLTAAAETTTHLIAGVVTGEGPGPDAPGFAPALCMAAALLPRIGALVADAGYDSEAAHVLCGALGIRRTAIRLNPRRGRKWPRTPRRRQMRKRFPHRVYGRRQRVESLFSQTKRCLGSALASRGLARQREEMVIRVLTHNLLILPRAARRFQQSRSDPKTRFGV